MKHIIAILLFSFSCFVLISQENYQKKSFSVKKNQTVNPKDIEPDFEPMLFNLEAPLPDGKSAKSYLMRQKIESKAYYSEKKGSGNSSSYPMKNGNMPEIGLTFEPKRRTPPGSILPIYGGIPSDNTMAVSNGGIIMIAMNSVLYAHDIATDTALFEDFQIYLRPFINGGAGSSYYDPKLLYDPTYDRFILTFLKDSNPDNSEIIMCFSSTNDPRDPWFVYNLPGNPLDNNRWTDFPCLAITEDKVYYTANLIIPDVSWQVGFDGSVIWEMDKDAAFSGAADISATLYHDIKFDDRFIRNLHPVNGANGIADEMILLSNRNFDIENDTIFYLKLNDGVLDVAALTTDLNYGVPPNGRQFDTNTSDPTNGLQTNDARVLGAIKFDDEIQFVGNTINPETGFSAIYHGVISNLNEETPTIQGKLISDPIKDFAYPNIAASGNEDCDREVIIAFDYTSPDHFPGVAAVHVNNERNCSPVLTVKEGYNFVDRLPGGYERWGDYFGLQKKFDEPGKTYSFGYLALANKNNSGYCAELRSPDTTTMHLNFSIIGSENVCSNTIQTSIVNGTAPFEYYWDGSEISSVSSTISGKCAGDTVHVRVVDAKSCSSEGKYRVPFAALANGISVYPNPSDDIAAAKFTLEEDAMVRAELYDESGRLVRVLLEKQAKKGLNEFVFSMAPLAQGMYTVAIFADSKMVHRFKIVKG